MLHRDFCKVMLLWMRNVSRVTPLLTIQVYILYTKLMRMYKTVCCIVRISFFHQHKKREMNKVNRL